MENFDYLKKTLKRLEAEIKGIQGAKNPQEISEHERMALPLLTEVQMAAPRLGEDIHRASQNRRKELQG